MPGIWSEIVWCYIIIQPFLLSEKSLILSFFGELSVVGFLFAAHAGVGISGELGDGVKVFGGYWLSSTKGLS